MEKIQVVKVVNIKCQGCARHIESELIKIGCSSIKVDVNKQEVEFVGSSRDEVEKKLGELGYPEASTPEAKFILEKAKSFVSCVIGKLKR